MARNKMSDLRDHLFATLEALQDQEEPMEIKRATAIAEVAAVIVDSARVEVIYMKFTGSKESKYFQSENLLNQ